MASISKGLGNGESQIINRPRDLSGDRITCLARRVAINQLSTTAGIELIVSVGSTPKAANADPIATINILITTSCVEPWSRTSFLPIISCEVNGQGL